MRNIPFQVKLFHLSGIKIPLGAMLIQTNFRKLLHNTILAMDRGLIKSVLSVFFLMIKMCCIHICFLMGLFSETERFGDRI